MSHETIGALRRSAGIHNGRAAAPRAPAQDLWVSTKCGESDTTSGCGANPTVGNTFDKLYPRGVTLVFGRPRN
jgi:altronate dehydratase